MRLAAITYSAPWGRAELFVSRELRALGDESPGLVVVPLVPGRELFHAVGQPLVALARWLPLLSPRIVWAALAFGVRHPGRLGKLLATLIRSARSPGILLRNLAVLPKSIFVARLMEQMGVDHIYANWATTPATMAFLVSSITGVPWSLRAHRWDIYQDNMLSEKARSAKFVLCVSEQTKRAFLSRAGQQFEPKVFVMPVGIQLDPLDERLLRDRIALRQHGATFRIVMPANLVEVKGHRYLLVACQALKDKGIRGFHLDLFGEGPLRSEIEGLIESLGLAELVDLRAPIPNEELLSLYRGNQVDLVVLPSINTERGEHEGLPTVLVEAMSLGVPVLSTRTGGIPELISEDAGMLVEEKSSAALTEAIERIMQDPGLALGMALAGREKASSEFDIHMTTRRILAKMAA